jgi:hypothetical protein
MINPKFGVAETFSDKYYIIMGVFPLHNILNLP